MRTWSALASCADSGDGNPGFEWIDGRSHHVGVTRRRDARVGEAAAVCCRDFSLARAGADRRDSGLLK